jgi:hypothetical protein
LFQLITHWTFNDSRTAIQGPDAYPGSQRGSRRSPHCLPPFLHSSSSCSLIFVASSPFVVHQLMNATFLLPSLAAINAPVHCIAVTGIGFLGGKLQTRSFLERCSRLALLETTGHHPSLLLLSAFSLTLPSQRQTILFPCSFSFFPSFSPSSSRERSICRRLHFTDRSR